MKNLPRKLENMKFRLRTYINARRAVQLHVILAVGKTVAEDGQHKPTI